MAVLRTEKAMMRVMCGVKLIEKKSQELTSLLGLKDNLDRLARASGVRWHWHVLSRDSDEMLRRALDFEAVKRRGHERSNMMWKKQSKNILLRLD